MLLANMSSDLANQITCIARDMAQNMEKSALPECPHLLLASVRFDLADQNLKEVILVKNYAIILSLMPVYCMRDRMW